MGRSDRWSRAIGFLLVLALLPASCGRRRAGGGDGDDSGGDGDSDADADVDADGDADADVDADADSDADALTVEEYCALEAELEGAWCDYVARCCTEEDRAAPEFFLPACRFGPDAPADCVEWAGSLLAEGRIEFDGTHAQACIDEQRAWVPQAPVECDGAGFQSRMRWDAPGDLQILECRRTFVGQMAQADPCDYSAECVAGLSCQESRCVPVGGAGAPCATTNDCVEGLQCIGFDHCGTPGDAGEPCSGFDCLPGLHCYYGDDECRPDIGAGSNCESDPTGCEAGTSCSDVFGACAGLKDVGQRCDWAFECVGRCDTEARDCEWICGGRTHFAE